MWGDKPATRRRAVAGARLVASPATVDAILGGTLGKGDALAVARVAGLMAAKKTSELIPLCHPIVLTSIEVDIVAGPEAGTLAITATAETTDRTGVEMEALTAVSRRRAHPLRHGQGARPGNGHHRHRRA